MEKDGHFCKTMLPINSFPALFVCAFDPPNSFIEMTPISTAQTDISLAAVPVHRNQRVQIYKYCKFFYKCHNFN